MPLWTQAEYLKMIKRIGARFGFKPCPEERAKKPPCFYAGVFRYNKRARSRMALRALPVFKTKKRHALFTIELELIHFYSFI